jgi:hypothetical protein
MLRKNVSISDSHLKLLDPLLKKHQGNLSAAMREIIDFTGFVTENIGCLESAKNLLKEKNHAREETRNRIYGVTIPLTMFRWLLNNRKGVFPPLNEVIQIFLPHNANIYDINSLDKVISEELSLLNWPVTVAVGHENGHISFQITGTDPEINKFNAILIAMFFANNKKPQRINKSLVYPASIYMQFSEAASREEAVKSLQEAFSDMKQDEMCSSQTYLMAQNQYDQRIRAEI